MEINNFYLCREKKYTSKKFAKDKALVPNNTRYYTQIIPQQKLCLRGIRFIKKSYLKNLVIFILLTNEEFFKT